MSSNPIPTASETAPAQPMPPHLQALHELLDISMAAVRLVYKQAEVEVEAANRLNEPTPDFTIAFDRASRSVRRTVLLIERLIQAAKVDVAVPALDRKFSARKQVIRAVEDSIQRDAPVDAAEDLQAEFRERLDNPEIEDEIGDRPVEEIIAEIKRDLGIAVQAGTRGWMRRTPKDVALLCVRAGNPRPAVGPFVLPMPPRTWTPIVPLFEQSGVGAGRPPGDGRFRGG